VLFENKNETLLTMKRFLSLAAAGALGAVITIGAYQMIEGPSINSGMWPDLIHRTGFNPSVSGTAAKSNRIATPAGSAGETYSINTNAIDFTTAAEKAMPAVVQIKALESEELALERRNKQHREDPWSRFFDFGNNDFFNLPFGQSQPRQGAGSGVIISKDGYIVTNNHVVDFADRVTIRMMDGAEYEAEIIGRDPSTDLAVLKIDASGLPVLEYANSDEVKVGEWVLAVGNPFEYLTSTVTAGIISAKGRDIDLIRGEKAIEEFIQTDAAINPGNSGGALVDTDGNLLGINTAIASYTGNYAGYSFAIPVNLMKRIVTDIMDNGGDIERTTLGVSVEEIDEDYAEEAGLALDHGLLVRSLESGGAAEFAGILPNDIIVEVDGKEATKFDDLKEIIDYAKVGDTLKVKVYRKGKYVEVPVRLRKKI
jgi:serine protease Do